MHFCSVHTISNLDDDDVGAVPKMQVVDATQSALGAAKSVDYASKEKALESLLSAPVIFQEATNPASKGLGIPNGYKAINGDAQVRF